jgi:DNA polymerase III alpha subunit
VKTQLKNRTLWFDGTVQVAPELVPELLLSGVPIEKIVVTEVTEDVQRYNTLADVPIAASKEKLDPLNMSWNIPGPYLTLDIAQYIAEKMNELQLGGYEKYVKRAEAELLEIRVRGMEPLIRTLIFIMDTLKREKVVWGVGRGSSCASLILFIIGLHKVDPIRFNIPMTEFFHD